MNRHECIIVGSLDPIESEYLARIPRHITLMPWFSVEEEVISNLQTDCAEFIAENEPLIITGKAEAKYGPNGEVTVRLVEHNDAIMQLHQKLFTTVMRYGGSVRRPEYTGEHYSPHVSKWTDSYLEENERVTVNRVQLVQSVENQNMKRRVLAQWSTGGAK